MQQRLQCQKLVQSNTGPPTWKTIRWQELVSSTPMDRRTVVYVHGNRVSTGRDKNEGMQIYRSFRRHNHTREPIRYIIWSWPSTQVPGPVKDYKLKAAYTHPVAWQFGWFLQQLPSDTPLSLIGYSYGTRVVCGAMHLLDGGHLGRLSLPHSKGNSRPSARVALIAAAYDVDWLQPGHFYGRAIKQIPRLVLITNSLDPAMRFYHLSNGRGRVHALGRAGVENIRSFGRWAQRIKEINFTAQVQRSHTLRDYLAVSSKMNQVWHYLMAPAQKSPPKVALLDQLLPWIR